MNLDQIKRVGVIGSGLMGQGIAQVRGNSRILGYSMRC